MKYPTDHPDIPWWDRAYCALVLLALWLVFLVSCSGLTRFARSLFS